MCINYIMFALYKYIYVIKFIKIYMKHIPNSCVHMLNFIMGNVRFVYFIDSSIASLDFEACL